jgi:Holliday junction resolvase RusA-like endonuclease
MKLTLSIPGIPQPKQSVRARIIKTKTGKSFIHTYQKKEVVENERSIKMIILEQLPPGFTPFSKGIKVMKLHYIFPPISSLKRHEYKILIEGGIFYKTTKPDLTDNLNKGLFDSMQGIVFMNDSQICEMNDVKKYYGLTPGILIEMEEIETPNLFN